MRRQGAGICVPQPPPPGSATFPLMDLKSGYVLRSLDSVPRQGEAPPWRLHQNYLRDIRMLRHGPVEDQMQFRAAKRADVTAQLAAVA